MLTVHTEGVWTKRPAEKRIFGNFMESGFGRQIPGMWSEMIYNRAFRKIPPYTEATWEWLGLDEEHYNENMPSWHSGYEEYDWEPVGNPSLKHLIGTRTYKGTSALRVTNPAEGNLCGLKQKGIHLEEGREYRMLFQVGAAGSLSQAGLEGFGTTEHTAEQYPFTITLGSLQHTIGIGTVTKKYEWCFTAPKTETTELSLLFNWKGAAVFSSISLMPADAMGGWRRDVVEQLRKVAPPVVRFPGGCFVSFYNWESSVGDREARDPMPSYYWGGLEENDVGLDEFLELSRLVGFEPQICFNMMTSEPFKARQLVEYLNAPSDVGMGRLRMLNGHSEPYGVKLFEMDNEPCRKWTPTQYAEQCVRFAEEMRLADPSIELMMAAYDSPAEALPSMLEIAGKSINYVIYRQGWPAFVEKVMPVIRGYNEKNGTNIRLVNTEWLPSCGSVEPFEDPSIPTNFRWHGEITNDYRSIFGTHQGSWNYALNGAVRLMDYMSYGGEFAIANFNNMCNTWGQNVIEATKDTCYLSCMGEVFCFFNRNFEPCYAVKTVAGEEGNSPAARPRAEELRGYDPEEKVSALLTKNGKGIEKLYLVNHSSSAETVVLPEGNWICADAIYADGRIIRAKPDEQVVKPCDIPVEDGKATLRGMSLCCLVKA